VGSIIASFGLFSGHSRPIFVLFIRNNNQDIGMKTFIFVHGSWHGSWNWHRVVPILEQLGHRAITIDLPGMGRDKTPIQEVKLQASVDAICRIIDDLEEQVILVGHSKNGIMISQTAEYRPHRIEKLVYLAAYLIPNGKTQREYSQLDTEGVLKPYVTVHPELNASTLAPEIYREGLYADCDDHIVQLAKVLLSPEPLESGITPLQLTDENFGSVPRVYIECTLDKAVTPFIQQKMYNEMPCEKVYRMETSHSPFFSRPAELAEILVGL
jgi:pimeloyl-ACP methyl ester carboxylesterase